MSKLKMPAKGNSAAMLAELQAEHAAATPATDEATTVLTPAPEPPADPEAPPASPPPAELAPQDRLAFALGRAATDDLIVVTVRVSASLNHYMDEYVARRRSIDPKSKYRKQDAVAKAFAEFYAAHPLPSVPTDEGAFQ